MTWTLGVDVGGTFTDVVLSGARGLLVEKVLTTPDDPRVAVARGVRQVLHRSGVTPSDVTRFVHGTTLATNVILERTGSDVAFVTTAGFTDMLRLGREARVEDDRYDLFFRRPDPPVDQRLTYGIDERIGADGAILRPLSDDAVGEIVARLREVMPPAVAICLLNSYVNDIHERRVANALRTQLPGTFVAVSSEIWPEVREYDRAMTAVLSAYVGPRLSSYLRGLTETLRDLGLGCEIDVMESSGGILSAEVAAQKSIYTVESGGAAGATAAGYLAGLLGTPDVISFDMGGTTAKAGVVRNGRVDVTHSFQVGGKGSYGSARVGTGFPVKIPVVDLAEVGAGGGSIAWVDVGGAPRIGPQSSGATPGPACYDRGGTRPTVTDANLVLGYLDESSISDGLSLNVNASIDAIHRDVATPMGLSVLDAAWVIHQIANSNMAAAIRVVTVQRGIDPRSFTLVGFGGAGPLHAARLAAEFGIETVIIPRSASAASAVGLIAADPVAHRVTAIRASLSERADLSRLDVALDELATSSTLEFGTQRGVVRCERSAQMRYEGQAHQLSVPVPEAPEHWSDAETRFRELYYRDFGVRLAAPVEVCGLQVHVSSTIEKPIIEARERTATAPPRPRTSRLAWFESAGMRLTPVFDWDDLSHGDSVDGPALVIGTGTTALVPEHAVARIDALGNLVVQLAPPAYDEESPSS